MNMWKDCRRGGGEVAMEWRRVLMDGMNERVFRPVGGKKEKLKEEKRFSTPSIINMRILSIKFLLGI